MSKRSLDKKAARQLISDGRSVGKSDKAIFDELATIYFDQNTIAHLIASTPTEQQKQRYKVLNTILLVVLGMAALRKILYVTVLSVQARTPWLLLTVLFVPLWNIVFMVEIARYRGFIYRLCALITALGLLQGLMQEGWVDGLGIVMTMSVIVMSFYLGSRLAPHLGLFGKLDKDANGDPKF